MEQIFARPLPEFHLAAGEAFARLETVARDDRARFPERDSQFVADAISRFCPADAPMVEIADDEHANVFALSSFVYWPACLVLLARAHRL